MHWQTVKVKAEARLDLLRQAGVAVETWLKSAMNQVMEELENERWNNLNTHDPSLSVRATKHKYIHTCNVLVCFDCIVLSCNANGIYNIIHLLQNLLELDILCYFHLQNYVTQSFSLSLFLQGTADLEREDEEEMEDSGEVLDDSSSSPSSTLKNYPLTCKVLYSYKVPAYLWPLVDLLLSIQHILVNNMYKV